MRAGWREQPLGELCSIQSGSSNTQDAVSDGAYLLFDRSRTPKRSNRYLFDCEALIIAGEGAEFKPKRHHGKFDLHQRAYAIYGFGDCLIGDYLYYYLEHIHEYFQNVAVGATVKSLRQRHFDRLPVVFPTSLDEQRRIVAVLDKAFANIATATANAQKNLTNARALFESYLRASINERGEGWSEYGFDQICSISSKLVDPRLAEYIDLPHVGAGNMESRTGGITDVLTAREEGLKSGKFLFDPSMVLYSKIRPYLMKACRPDFAGLCSADVYPLVPKAGLLDRDMLFHILMSEDFTTYAEAGSARAGMPKVNRDHLFKYSVWLPDVKAQRSICDKLDDLSLKCQNLKEVFQTKLAALTELKQSLLQKAFAGELT